VSARSLLGELPAGARATVTSPGALTYDDRRDEIVMCNGFRVFLPGRSAPYALLAGYAMGGRAPAPTRPLWQHPLAATPAGVPLPGPGTFGQPALFAFGAPDGAQRTGVIINTVRTGTYILKG
jgi:hypothetical protein